MAEPVIEAPLKPKRHAVYVLRGPEGEIRYVGVTKSPEKRLARHLREAKARKTHRHRWVMSLVDAGVVPTLDVVEWADDWDEAERRLVAKYRADGCDLVNGNDGGSDMRQSRIAPTYPNIKRHYRTLEAVLRVERRRGGDRVVKLAAALEMYRRTVARARKAGAHVMYGIEHRLAARYANG